MNNTPLISNSVPKVHKEQHWEKKNGSTTDRISDSVIKWSQPILCELIMFLAYEGNTQTEIRQRLNVDDITWNHVIKKIPEVKDALKGGKDLLQCRIENALIKSALGMHVTEVTRSITKDGDGNVIRELEETKEKEIPPNVAAIQTWLFSNCRDKYQRNPVLEGVGDSTINIQVRKVGNVMEVITAKKEDQNKKMHYGETIETFDRPAGTGNVIK